MRYVIFLLTAIFIISCSKKEHQTLKKGTYKAELLVQDNQILPFIFKVDNEKSIRVFNANEVIDVNEITYKNDSVYIQTPVFEGYIVAKIENGVLQGSFIKESLDRVVPFKASPSTDRFRIFSQDTPKIVQGVWEAVFSQNIEKDEYIAKGIFKQNGNTVTGTFRTTTGDYRYLEGVMDKDSLKLSTFDGAHAFLFQAKVTDSTMTGVFYSGNHWKEPFIAKRNDAYELPSANTLTFLNKGYDRFDFSFENEQGKLISLNDKQFQNKVVVVQVMGTWCPNCLDESKYYTKYAKEHPNSKVAFVALAFEYAKTKEIAFKRIQRLKRKVGIPYPILLAQYGSSDKKLAQEKLPMLNHIISYPTSIFIDKQGKVRKIHTGFNGPATGQKYLDFQKEFESFIDTLSKE
ncbi:TlpA disulfide reductase family protein [Flavobacteriaceae bacterium S356]|uniref:TlpA disulfide reductase family protein n=1 Tax=Asprobacillus argus TaxID=3076534 RepID=A0ABU3LE95_9FLAO|nr:TlpA disulfide reductase family protein [Flavobacteriaceae bacterium S356]